MAKKPARKRNIEQYDHKGKKRINNPPVGLGFYNESEVADDGMWAGDSAFVLKEYAGTDLFDAIKSVQTGETFI